MTKIHFWVFVLETENRETSVVKCCGFVAARGNCESCFVGLSARLRENHFTDFYRTWIEDGLIFQAES